jgi:hypothetical protein
VSNLEEVKMSLIGAAMRNSHARAEEFAKNGDVKVGSMRSASQGAFYIRPASANAAVSDWGGTYDKTTVDKIARVVVTVDYGIERGLATNESMPSSTLCNPNSNGIGPSSPGAPNPSDMTSLVRAA